MTGPRTRRLAPEPGAHHTVSPPTPAPFTLVMRDDTDYCARELATRIARDTHHPAPRLTATLASAYRRFQAELRAALHEAAGRPDPAEIHLVDAAALDRAMRHRAGDGEPLLSLDPLMQRAVTPLRLSRGFLLGGTRSVGLVARPGARAIGEQLRILRARWGARRCTLLDDDVCTADTVREVLRLLRTAGITISRIVPGVQLASAERLRQAVPGVPVTPVLEYRYPQDQEGSAGRVRLADPRNFLLGVSGLTVLLPDGTWGRAPYWLPFVRTAARVGLCDATHDRPFALAMLRANSRFYTRVEQTLATSVRVRHLPPCGGRLLCSTGLAASPDTPVRAALDALEAVLDRRTGTPCPWQRHEEPPTARSLTP